MARPRRGRRHGRRGCPRQENPGFRPTEATGNQRRRRRTTKTVVQEAAQAYQEGTNEDICHIIQNMESSVMEE